MAKLLTKKQEKGSSKKIDQKAVSKLLTTMKTMLLTKKQENLLFRKLHRGDIAARDELVKANLSLIDWVARNYVNNDKSLSLAQLKELGMTGLNKAIEKYDSRKSYKFSSYATWWIRQAIHDTLGIKGR